MKAATTVLQMLVRLTGVIALVLGLLLWTGNALGLVTSHMWLGVILVLSLWALAVLAGRAGAKPGMVALAIVWGLALPIVGIGQLSWMPGSAHWVIQVIHLLLGVGAIGLAERLGAQIKESMAPEATQSGSN